MKTNESNNATPTTPYRDSMVRLLRIGHPEADLTDNEVLFCCILDDYADYARLLDAEHRRLAAGTPDSDGLPHLGGAIANANVAISIFDLARGA